MHALTEIFGDDYVLQYSGGTLGHPWENAPDTVAYQVALSFTVFGVAFEVKAMEEDRFWKFKDACMFLE